MLKFATIKIAVENKTPISWNKGSLETRNGEVANSVYQDNEEYLAGQITSEWMNPFNGLTAQVACSWSHSSFL